MEFAHSIAWGLANMNKFSRKSITMFGSLYTFSCRSNEMHQCEKKQLMLTFKVVMHCWTQVKTP